MQAASRQGRRWRRFCPSWRPAAASRFRSVATWPQFCRALPMSPFIALRTLPPRRGLPGSSSTPLFVRRKQLSTSCRLRWCPATHTCSSFTPLLHHQIRSWNRWFPLTLTFQRSLPRHFLLSASNHTERSVCVFKAWRNLSVRCWSEQKPNPGGGGPTASRWSAPVAPGKRTRREDHALLIVRDEFRTGYSLIGLLASIARLRFTGTARINCGRKNENGISSNGKCVFPAVSHRRGSPHSSAFIGVHQRPFVFFS